MRFQQMLIFMLGLLVWTSLPKSLQAELTIGSKAPALDIEYWLSKNDLPRVKTFEANKVYVIEFWATWCPPCVASMPHLAKLQNQFRDQGVQIISISDEEQGEVEEFLDRPFGKGKKATTDDKKQTYREITSAYSLTTDPDQSSYKDYMEAAGQSGIPSAFIVGKDGFIEWIGHPMELDEPLQLVVDGKWDRAEFLKKLQEQRKFEQAIEDIFNDQQAGRSSQALKKLDNLIEATEDVEIKSSLGRFKFQLLMESNPTAAAELLKELIAKTEELESLKSLAWQVVELAETDQTAAPKSLIEAALLAAEKAVKVSPKNGSAHDTLAHLVYLNGDIDKAIEIQKKAVELAPDVEPLKSFMKRLEQAKSK
jgi:thiol-disulfide isomerase/thioredoxin